VHLADGGRLVTEGTQAGGEGGAGVDELTGRPEGRVAVREETVFPVMIEMRDGTQIGQSA
jgi:hypothetical protein